VTVDITGDRRAEARVERQDLDEMIGNLVENAAKYGNGRVFVTVEAKPRAVDVLVAVNNGSPVLLRNTAAAHNHWLGIRLIGRKANIDAIGAKIVYQAGALKRHVTKVGGGSYLSSHDPRIVLGLGQEMKLDWIEVHWPQPSGKIERFTSPPIDRYITIVEGQGTWKQSSPGP